MQDQKKLKILHNHLYWFLTVIYNSMQMNRSAKKSSVRGLASLTGGSPLAWPLLGWDLGP